MPFVPPDFDLLFESHCDFAWRALCRHGVAERDLEDQCQEVFVVVHRNLARFEGRSSLKTWIYAICRRVAANYRARAAVGREMLVLTAQDDVPSPVGAAGQPFEQLATKEGLALLEALLGHLPAERREVFLLYEVEGMSMREVAEALECPEDTAYSRLYAARRELEAAVKRLRAQRRVA